MRYLYARYRHDIVCQNLDCNKRIIREGDLSAALHFDGSADRMLEFDTTLRHVFEVTCPDGHVAQIHYPKDVMIVRTLLMEADNINPPVIWRP